MFARTKRLLLRPAWESDASALAQAISGEGIARNLAHVPWPYSLADAEAFIADPRAIDEPALLIFLRCDGAPRLIGGAGLARMADGGHELGYWIERQQWGLGYATEAAVAVIDIARHALRIERLNAGHFIDNPASGRVLAKLGFHPGGTAERYSRARGGSTLCREFTLRLDHADAKAAPCEQVAA